MQVHNNTTQVLVFGKTLIKPQQSGNLSADFDDHPTIDLLLRMRKITARRPVDPEPSIVDFLQAKNEDEPETLTFKADDTSIPAGWDEMHGNKCRAWIKRQTDLSLLGKMAAIEDRPKIRAAIQVQIDTLETSS
jgi:hypothetical protein